MIALDILVVSNANSSIYKKKKSILFKYNKNCAEIRYKKGLKDRCAKNNIKKGLKTSKPTKDIKKGLKDQHYIT
jgi:ligand-binding sensor protein